MRGESPLALERIGVCMEERLKVLLYNAMVLLADKTIGEDDMFADWLWEICEAMGTTPTELKMLGVDFDEMF